MPTIDQNQKAIEENKEKIERIKREREAFVNSFPKTLYFYKYTRRSDSTHVYDEYSLVEVVRDRGKYMKGREEKLLSLTAAKAKKKQKPPIVKTYL